MPADIQHLKTLARALRAQTGLSHGKALETVARQHGYRDWNSAAALAPAAQPTPPSTRMRNRTLHRIVCEYRRDDVAIRTPAVIAKLAREYPGMTYDGSTLNAAMNLSLVDVLRTLGPVPEIRHLPPGVDEDLERYARNPGYNEDEDESLNGIEEESPETAERRALEHEIGPIEDEVNDNEEREDEAGTARAMERHNAVMDRLTAAEFAEDYDEEGEVRN